MKRISNGNKKGIQSGTTLKIDKTGNLKISVSQTTVT